jgi:ABC-type branched-subunit amino acid transport system permease subunit
MVGAVVFVLLGQFVSLYVTRWITLMGLVLIVVVLFARRGLWGELRAGLRSGQRWLERRRDAPRVGG